LAFIELFIAWDYSCSAAVGVFMAWISGINHSVVTNITCHVSEF